MYVAAESCLLVASRRQERISLRLTRFFGPWQIELTTQYSVLLIKSAAGGFTEAALDSEARGPEINPVFGREPMRAIRELRLRSSQASDAALTFAEDQVELRGCHTKCGSGHKRPSF